MKLWKPIIVAGAILTLAVSAGIASAPEAGAKANRILHKSDVQVNVSGSRHLVNEQAKTIRSLRAKVQNLSARNDVLKATVMEQNAAIASLQQRLWAVTPPLPPVPVDPALSDSECSDYMLCTAEQACRIWGDSCHLVSPPVINPPATETPDSGNETSEPVEPPVVTTPVAPPLECASYHDPAIVSESPEDYDSTC